jgi:hypothetical protein
MTFPRPFLLIAFAVVSTLSGCGLTGVSGADEATGEGQGQEMADVVVHEQAEDLAGELSGVIWLEQAVYLEAQVPLHVREEYPDTDIDRVLLVSETSTDELGEPVFHLVARVRVHVVPEEGYMDWGTAAEEATVARCFAYDVRRGAEVEPDETDCPDTEPIRVDPSIKVPQQPQVRARDEAAVRGFLRGGSTATDIDELQATLGRGLTARALDESGVTAVAVTARPDGDDCVLGRRGPHGRIAVWHPDPVHTMPGEMGCVPELVTHPPL